VCAALVAEGCLMATLLAAASEEVKKLVQQITFDPAR
jgi:hypothetical protein